MCLQRTSESLLAPCRVDGTWMPQGEKCHEPTPIGSAATQNSTISVFESPENTEPSLTLEIPKTEQKQLLNQLCLGNPPQAIRNSNGVRAHEDGGGAHEHRHGGHWDHHSDVSIHGCVEMDRHGWENLYVWKELEILVLDMGKENGSWPWSSEVLKGWICFIGLMEVDQVVCAIWYCVGAVDEVSMAWQQLFSRLSRGQQISQMTSEKRSMILKLYTLYIYIYYIYILYIYYIYTIYILFNDYISWNCVFWHPPSSVGLQMQTWHTIGSLFNKALDFRHDLLEALRTSKTVDTFQLKRCACPGFNQTKTYKNNNHHKSHQEW